MLVALLVADSGLRFVNADVLSASLNVSAYEAAELASSLRSAPVAQRESFIFETVLSDPVGEKDDQFANYAAHGYTVVLIFIQIDSPEEAPKPAVAGSDGVVIQICVQAHTEPWKNQFFSFLNIGEPTHIQQRIGVAIRYSAFNVDAF